MSRHANPPDDVATRPTSFDTAVAAYLPFLRRLAWRLERNAQDRDDVVQETVENALSRWTSYRTDMPLAGWLAWRMRHVVSKRRARRKLSTTAIGEHATPATQYEYVEARETLRLVNGISKDRDIVVRLMLGDTQAEIARDYGVSRERITTRARRGRCELAERLREAA